jgi:hypothetical protein
MSAINLNAFDYYATGVIRFDNGRERCFDAFVREPIVCPQVHRYGPEIEKDDRANHHFRIPNGCVGFTITYLTCEKRTADSAPS